MKKTKRSLLRSAVALLLCFSMLLGSTWAWFTDYAGSAENVVQAGMLDAEMYWSESFLALDSDEWQNADGVPVFTYDNWEPGYTDVKYIKIKNAGNLAFKWRLTIEAEGEVTDLAEVIDVYYVNPITAEMTGIDGYSNVGTLDAVIDNHITDPLLTKVSLAVTIEVKHSSKRLAENIVKKAHSSSSFVVYLASGLTVNNKAYVAVVVDFRLQCQ